MRGRTVGIQRKEDQLDRQDDNIDGIVLDSLRSLLLMAKEAGMTILTVSEFMRNIEEN